MESRDRYRKHGVRRLGARKRECAEKSRHHDGEPDGVDWRSSIAVHTVKDAREGECAIPREGKALTRGCEDLPEEESVTLVWPCSGWCRLGDITMLDPIMYLVGR